jgi:hypothetical protein
MKIESETNWSLICLATSAAEEAFGRIARDREGLFEITGNQTSSPTVAAHPGYGTDPDTAKWTLGQIQRVRPSGALSRRR